MLDFENPYYFLLLLLVPVGILAQKRYVKWQVEKQGEFGNKIALNKLIDNKSESKSKLKFTLQIVAFFFIVLALVNPKLGTKTQTVNAKGVEVVFVLDVSKSMLCNDIKPNRLEKAKQIITQTINALGSDRIGIVAYAGNAYPVLPMTSDYELGKMFSQTITTDIISSQGTNIKEALETSVAFFDNPTSGKAIVLLSDGEDHEDTDFDVAGITKAKNVRVITVGIGTENGGQIEFTDENGFQQVKKDKDGQVVITKINESFLNEIASETKGTYVRNNSNAAIVSSIKESLDKVKKSEVKANLMSQKESQFQWFLGIALLLLIANVFIVERKFSKYHIKEMFTGKSILILVFYLFSFVAFGQQEPNNKIKEQRLRTLKAKQKSKEQSTNYNLANSIYKQKKYEDATYAYKKATETAKTNTEQHKVFHNLGNSCLKNKDYKKAVEAYKSALKANPKDEKTRYNLALAKKLLEKNSPKLNKNKNKEKNKKNDKNKEKDKQNKEKEKQEQQEQKKKATKQQASNVLKAISEAEKKTQQKVNAQKTNNKTIITDKDW